jgi:signal transduction histidine kinase
MILLLAGAVSMAVVSSLLLGRSILGPIRGVTHGAQAVSRGELDQLVPATTRDELGELATAFNTMARTIREYRDAGTAKLLRAQKAAQATIDSFPDPVVVVDPLGLVERANPASRRILGVASADGEAVPWSPPAMLASHLAEVLGGQADYLPTGLENAICLRDEEAERFFMPRIVSIRSQDGSTLGAAVVLVDVTKFRLVDQLKSDMISTVSHELKTPLTGLQMAVHLLLEEIVGPLTPKQTELLLSARQDSGRLLAIVNDLLDLTRIERGQLDLKPTAPAELVRDVVNRFESMADSAGIELRGSVGFGLPPIHADSERLSHVFDNLIKNALIHTARGGAVSLTAEAVDRTVQFTVEDNGEGISADYLPRVFDRFARVPGSRATDGDGLGLAIAKEIVTAHGGEIAVSSREGEGTKFTFSVPVDVPAARPVRPRQTRES